MHPLHSERRSPVRSMNRLIPLVALAALLLAGLPVLAANVATVTHLNGTLTASQPGGTPQLLAVSSTIEEGSVLRTGQNTYARLKFVDNSEVVLRPNTELDVTAFRYQQARPEEDSSLLRLVRGGMRAVTGLLGKRNHDKVRLDTVTATIGIRGTHFGVLLCQQDCQDVPTTSGTPPPDGMHVDVVSGAVSVTNPAGEIVLQPGHFGYVRDATTAPREVPPEQGFPVTMPLLISKDSSTGIEIGNQGDNACVAQ